MNQNDSNINIQDLPSYKLFKRTSYAGNLNLIQSMIAFGLFAYLAVNIAILSITERSIPLALTALVFGGVPTLFAVVLTDKWRRIERGEILYQYLAVVEDKYSSKLNATAPGKPAQRLYYVTVNSPREDTEIRVGKRIYKMLEAGDEVVVFSTSESNAWALPLN